MEIKKENQELVNIDEQNFSVRQFENALRPNEFACIVLVNVLEKNKMEDLFFVKFMLKSSV